MKRHLNYHHLRYFRAVAHAGSLTRAARELNLSQSAVSIQLGTLESQLGHRLFDRQGKRLVLTEAGRIALDYADTVFSAGEELLSTLSGSTAGRRRVLRVGAIATLSRNFHLEFLRPLLDREDVSLIVRSGSLPELLGMIRAHELDVVLANSAAQRDPRSDLRSIMLRRQPVSLVGRPSRKRARFKFPEELKRVPLILPSLNSEVRLGFDRILDAVGIHPVIRAEVDDMGMLRLLARETDALTLVPPIVVRDELSSGVLVEYHAIPKVHEEFFAIVQRRRFPNPLLADLIGTLTRGAG